MVVKVKEDFIVTRFFGMHKEVLEFIKDEELLVGEQMITGGVPGEEVKSNYIVYDRQKGINVLCTFNEEEFKKHFTKERVT